MLEFFKDLSLHFHDPGYDEEQEIDEREVGDNSQEKLESHKLQEVSIEQKDLDYEDDEGLEFFDTNTEPTQQLVVPQARLVQGSDIVNATIQDDIDNAHETLMTKKLVIAEDDDALKEIAHTRVALKGKALFKDIIANIDHTLEIATNGGEEEVDIVEPLFEAVKDSINSVINSISGDEITKQVFQQILNIENIDNSIKEVIQSYPDKDTSQAWAALKRFLEDNKELKGREEVNRLILQSEAKLEAEHLGGLSLKDANILKEKISLAAQELNKEFKKEDQAGFFWKYENSLSKEEKERSILDVAGRVYDIVGGMCHKIALTLGISKPTAAELFVEAAQYAQKLRNNIIAKQIAIEQDTAQKAELGNVHYYDLKRRGMDNTSDLNFKKKQESYADQEISATIEKYKEQYGAGFVARLLRRNANHENGDKAELEFREFHEDVQDKLEEFYKQIKSIKDPKLHRAYGEVMEALFIQDAQIGNDIYKGAIDFNKARTALMHLSKEVTRIGILQDEFQQINKAFGQIAENDNWVGRVIKTGVLGHRTRE